jgi:hypothetical protein
VNTVAIPYQNEKDLDEIPRPLRNKLHFVLARNMSDVLAAALDEKRVARRSKKSEQNPETKTKKLGNQNPTRPKKRRPERNVPLTG